MIIIVDESFKVDFKKLKNKEIQARIIKKIEYLESLWDISKVSNIKKMKGFEKYYRLRIWNYRIWFEYDWNIITLLRVRSRKDIYEIFP